jgi:hypothetical protein
VEQAFVRISQGGQQQILCFCECIRRGSHGFNFTDDGNQNPEKNT